MHPFQTARSLVRRSFTCRVTEDGPDYKPTGRKVWRQTIRSLSAVSKMLPDLMTEAGIAGRKERGAIRAALPAAHAAVTATRAAPRQPTLSERLDGRILNRAFGLSWQAPAGAEAEHFVVRDRVKDGSRLTLIGGAWWHEYSRRHGSRHHGVAVLTGYEDGQWWARRVPYGCRTVAEALDYIRPAEVNAAIAEGREVRRQGDVWLVQLKAGRNNLNAIRGTDHRLDGTTLTHPQHGSLDLGEGAWKAFLSKDTTRPMRVSGKWD